MELALEQFPTRIEVDGATLTLQFKPMGEAAEFSKLLVVLTDVTAEVARERSEQEQRELVGMFQRLSNDRAGFMEFFDEAAKLVHGLVAGVDAPAVAFRMVHTLKGNCGLFGAETVASFAHGLESKLAEEARGLTSAERDSLSAAWADFSLRLATLLGDRAEEIIELGVEEFDRLMDAVMQEVPRERLAGMLRAFKHEPAARRLARFGEKAKTLAERLGKGGLQVQISSDRLRLPAERWAPSWPAFAHAVRNAVDHGVERPEVREAAGKPRAGTLRLSTALQGDELVVAIEDDGAGVPWELVRAKAAERGLPHATRDDLIDALFADRLSTRDEVTTLSGRGVGLGALREAIRKLGGRVEVDSLPGRGARFAFITPVNDAGLELSALESRAKAA